MDVIQNFLHDNITIGTTSDEMGNWVPSGSKTRLLCAPTDDAKGTRRNRELAKFFYKRSSEQDGGLHASDFGEEVGGRAQ